MKKYLTLLSVVLLFGACSTKKKSKHEKTEEIDSDSVIFMLTIAPFDQIPEDKLKKDLETVKNRVNKLAPVRDAEIKNGRILKFKVDPAIVKRELLNDISNLILFKTPLRIREVRNYSEATLKKIKILISKNNQKNIKLQKVKGFQVLAASGRDFLQRFILKHFASFNWYFYRKERGPKDFSQSYWYAFILGEPVKFTVVKSPEKKIMINLKNPKKNIALLLDNIILDVKPEVSGTFTLKKQYSRITDEVITVISLSDPLNVSWKITKVEAEQRL